jgi:hypothetical protein
MRSIGGANSSKTNEAPALRQISGESTGSGLLVLERRPFQYGYGNSETDERGKGDCRNLAGREPSAEYGK